MRAQADRQGRSAEFGAAYEKSEHKTAAYAEIEKQLAMSSDLGEWFVLFVCLWCVRLGVWACGACRSAAPSPPRTHKRTHTHTHADEATRKDLAVKKDTVTPSWWAIRKLFKVGG